MTSWVLSILCLLTAPGWAHAQDGGDEEARALYAAGEVAYDEGRFEDALTQFQRAYELSGRPELLYNVGLAATNAGDERTALAALERYIAEIPDAPNRGIVEGRIANLRREIDEEDANERAAEEERARQADDEAARARAGADGTRAVGWALVITGGVLAAGGVATLVAGLLDVATVEGAAAGTPWASLRDAFERAPILTGVGYAALGVGCVLLGAGLGLALGTADPTVERPVALRIGPGSLGLEGAF